MSKRRLLPLAVLAFALAAGACAETKKDESTASARKDPAATGTASSTSASAAALAPKPNAIPAPPDVSTPPADAEKTASGLQSKVLQKGTGKQHPGPTDTVKVHYTGWTNDGEMFDSSVARGEPISFAVSGVIPGWTEGLQLMVVGEKRRLWIPASLAYGEKPRGGAPAGQLTFDVELLELIAPPPAPEDVKAPPASAKKTASGLAYRVLKSGKADAPHPKETDMVRVNYTGWTTDGKVFDTTVTRGQPGRFALNRVIKGWTEGVQLMKVGDTMRFWIPGNLAYGDKPKRADAPSGMLVFDIELVGIDAPR